MIRTNRARVWLFALLSACGKPEAPRAAAVAGNVASARGGDKTAETVAAANALLATLDDAERAKVAFPFGSAQMSKWSNFPSPMYARNGLRMGDLSAPQRAAVMKVLSVALSAQGFEKVREIMEGDEALKTSGAGRLGPAGGPGGPGGGPPPGFPGEGGPPSGGPPGRGRPDFGHDAYYLAFLGAPSLSEPWMIQFGGHHLAINLTMVGPRQAMTPSLPCAQPASYEVDGQTVRPLGREHDESLALVRSLSESQKAKAILPYQVGDLVLGPGQDGKTVPPEGIEASELNEAQQKMLLELSREWVGVVNDAAAQAKMVEIAAHLAETWFAWSGPLTGDTPAYFRIQGPTLWIEYSPQRGRARAGLDGDHVHTIYRDPTNDYGAALLER